MHHRNNNKKAELLGIYRFLTNEFWGAGKFCLTYVLRQFTRDTETLKVTAVVFKRHFCDVMRNPDGRSELAVILR